MFPEGPGTLSLETEKRTRRWRVRQKSRYSRRKTKSPNGPHQVGVPETGPSRTTDVVGRGPWTGWSTGWAVKTDSTVEGVRRRFGVGTFRLMEITKYSLKMTTRLTKTLDVSLF